MSRRTIGLALAVTLVTGLATVTATSSASAVDGMGRPAVEFGGTGVVTTALDSIGNPSEDVGNAVAVQSDGKVVVAGRNGDASFSSILVTRYLPDGTLDASFSGDGKVQVGLGLAHSSAAALEIDGSGRIVVAGTASNNQDLSGATSVVGAARLTSTGALDNSFSGDGRVTTNVGAGGGQGRGIAVLETGKVLITGFARSALGVDPKAFVLRYTSAGTLDGSFAVGGIRSLPGLPGRDYTVGNDVDFQFSGAIVVSGYDTVGADQFAMVARLTADGAIDNTFGTSGYVELNLQGSSDFAKPVSTLDAGSFFGNARIIVGLRTYVNNQDVVLTAMLEADGQNNDDGDLVPTYGGHGNGYAYPTLPDVSIGGMRVADDATAVIAGTTGSNAVMLTRLLPTGATDTSFGFNGVASYSGLGQASANDVAVAPAGTIYTAGANDVATDDVLVTAWYGTPQARPNAPIVTKVGKAGGAVTVSFRSGGGGRTEKYQYYFQRIAKNGSAGAASGVVDLAANATSITLPVTGSQPGIRLAIYAVGTYNISPIVQTAWRQVDRGRASRTCKRVEPKRIEFSGGRAKVTFKKRSSSCARWKFDQGRQVKLNRGKRNKYTPIFAAGTEHTVRLKAGARRTYLTIRGA